MSVIGMKFGKTRVQCGQGVHMPRQFVLEVWGDLACFTRPELKVERFSYPVITPSAARAIFDSIYIAYAPGAPPQPQFRWQVRRIEILSPIEYINLSRNEVKGKINVRDVEQWMRDEGTFRPLFANETGRGAETTGRTQRQTMALRYVHYRLHAEVILYNENKELRLTIERIFERRARNGQCMRQPYLGCREFVAYFALASNPSPQPIPMTEDLGWMTYDLFNLSQPNSSQVRAKPSAFFARVEHGVLEIPPYQSAEVREVEVID
jgi:CRISPR-associated protein Cas5d